MQVPLCGVRSRVCLVAHLVEPAEQLHHGALPRPALPHQRSHGAPLQSQVHALQNRSLGPLGVREVDVCSIDVVIRSMIRMYELGETKDSPQHRMRQVIVSLTAQVEKGKTPQHCKSTVTKKASMTRKSNGKGLATKRAVGPDRKTN
jgi:hypothetical protein